MLLRVRRGTFENPASQGEVRMRTGLRGNAAETTVEGEIGEEICMVNADLCARLL